jgi:hypothetical protein
VRDPVNEDRLRAVWEIELDRLELDVIRSERLLKGLDSMPTEPWSPPVIPGQIPLDLAERARDLLDRQERVTADLGVALAAAQTQVAYADRAHRLLGRDPSVPVYLDLEA